jgi:uncharacterized protein YjlB
MPRLPFAVVLSAAMASTPAAATAPPECLHFDDDGVIPNSALPLLLYRGAFRADGDAGARWLEQRFADNGWRGAWRWTVYPFHHYHSTSHEVLGVSAGHATLQFGGEHGRAVEVRAGDVVVIPAGVGHKRLQASAGFQVVGAYPDGRAADLLRGDPGERPAADRRIAELPLPDADPLLGKAGGTALLWR